MYRHFFKRALDILFSVVLLPVLLLSFLFCAPAIWLTDRGPVFYNAERRGKDGRCFKMFKYRSMAVNSPELHNADGSTYTGDDDPRVTKIGRLMRKTSVDELPQILNVLIGDMSFIGPRPTLTVTPYEQLPEDRRHRLLVRPGITGYAQAYFRNSIPQEEKFRCDCYYVDHLTFAFDLKILFHTVYSVAARKNINHADGEEDRGAREENAPAGNGKNG